MITPRFFLLLLLLSFTPPALGWDSVGHRITSAVALNYLNEEKRIRLIEILAFHPRYQEDFLNRIPDFVDQADEQDLSTWLLGQAAYWPDIARGLASEDRARYNRPAWHFTDGAWLRGAAQTQGNIYLETTPFATIAGEPPASIASETQAHNVVTAIDYNSRLLTNDQESAPDRAIALCWVLHLIGDIHQPLHTGSLFTPTLFAEGDRGGNGIPTGSSGNLHGDWDRALRSGGFVENLPLVLNSIAGYENSTMAGIESDSTVWMAESREILNLVVYSDAMRSAVQRADENSMELNELELSSEYITGMQNISRQRLGLAGYRLAIFFENELE
jgi:hypothetical protein